MSSDANTSSPCALRVVERLDAQSIAGQQHLPSPRHPRSPARTFRAAGPRTVGRGLRTDGRSFRCRSMSGTCGRVAPARAEAPVVVDLAVEDDPDRAILVRHGLLAAVEVDDAQPAHAEPHAVAEVDALLVGSSMGHRPAHGPQSPSATGAPSHLMIPAMPHIGMSLCLGYSETFCSAGPGATSRGCPAQARSTAPRTSRRRFRPHTTRTSGRGSVPLAREPHRGRRGDQTRTPPW